MRSRDQLKSLIKTFEVEPGAAGDKTKRREGESVGLIGGDIRRIVQTLPPILTGARSVDAFRDEGSVRGFIGAAAMSANTRLEIGSAKGHFALAMAERDPDGIFLASEVRSVHCKTILKKGTQRELNNLYVMLGDIRLHLPRLVASGPVFDEVYILFPDPWWKRKHRKRRLFQPGFLEFVAEALKPSGRLIIKTDVEPYKIEIERLVEAVQEFERVDPEEESLFLEAMPPTRREQELTEANLPIYGMVLSREAGESFPESGNNQPR